MAHATLKSSYSRLADRLNRFPQGAPPTELLFKILKMLFSEKEAELVSLLPIKPFSAEKASQVWKMGLASTRKILEELAARAILLDIDRHGESVYVLPPPMAGFFEFSLMRVREDIDQKLLSELFYQYLNVEEDFVRQLFTRGETQLGRTFVHEPAISEDCALHVLDYERASEVIKTASHRAIGICYCRHKMQHLDRACAAPLNICMTFNTSAASLIKHAVARPVEVAEGLDLLQQAYACSLVQFGENVRERVSFICNCCSCCCEAMVAARRFAILNPVHTTNFIPEVHESTCNGCAKCVNACPVEAMTLVSSNDPQRPKMKKAKLAEDVCLGCGLCVRACPRQSVSLKSRPKRVITPLNGVHRTVIMAIERDQLQNLLFDNQALYSHRAMAAVLGVILRLPPIKQALASQQVKSRYLETLISRAKVES
jgi:ferredoxin